MRKGNAFSQGAIRCRLLAVETEAGVPEAGYGTIQGPEGILRVIAASLMLRPGSEVFRILLGFSPWMAGRSPGIVNEIDVFVVASGS